MSKSTYDPGETQHEREERENERETYEIFEGEAKNERERDTQLSPVARQFFIALKKQHDTHPLEDQQALATHFTAGWLAAVEALKPKEEMK